MIEVIKAEDIPNLGDYDINIYNAIIVPKGATNGDILKLVFPNTEWERIHDLKGDKSIGCTNKFWNAPYKKAEREG